MSGTWEWVALGVDAALSLMFYSLWKKGSRNADVAEQVEQVYVGPELESRLAAAPDNTLPYVCIEGVTEAIGSPLTSMYKPECERGVIQKISLIEHRSRRTQGYWTDSKRVIRDATNITPFQLVPLRCQNVAGTGLSVQVSEPLAAEYLMDDLKVTYDKFEPSQSTVVEKGVDRLFGDVSKGFQETEKMLGVGVHLLGMGRVVREADGRLRICPPQDGQRYILTTLTKQEAVKVLRTRAAVVRVLFYLCAGVGVSLLSYWTYKRLMQWKRDRDMRRAMEEFRRSRAGDADEGNEDDGDSEDKCVICMTDKRAVVLLNCGHICMCASCAQELPEPKVCPVCRSKVERIQPVYMS